MDWSWSWSKPLKGERPDRTRLSSTTTDSNKDSTNELDPAKITSKKKSATQWIEQIEKDNTCEEHIRKFCLKFTIHHHQLSKEVIGT
jgi:hypothetical protein